MFSFYITLIVISVWNTDRLEGGEGVPICHIVIFTTPSEILVWVAVDGVELFSFKRRHPAKYHLVR